MPASAERHEERQRLYLACRTLATAPEIGVTGLGSSRECQPASRDDDRHGGHKDGYSHEAHKGHEGEITKKFIWLLFVFQPFVSFVTFVAKSVFVFFVAAVVITIATEGHKDGFSHEAHKGHEGEITKEFVWFPLAFQPFVSFVTFVAKSVFVFFVAIVLATS